MHLSSDRGNLYKLVPAMLLLPFTTQSYLYLHWNITRSSGVKLAIQISLNMDLCIHSQVKPFRKCFWIFKAKTACVKGPRVTSHSGNHRLGDHLWLKAMHTCANKALDQTLSPLCHFLILTKSPFVHISC